MSEGWTRALARYGTVLGALVVCLGFALAAPGFLAAANLLGIVREVSLVAILGTGFALALTASELDLSFANLASLAAVVTGGLVRDGAAPEWAVAAGLGVGLGGGVLNGAIVTWLKIPSLIATLATAAIAGGLASMVTDGVAVAGFTGLGGGALLWVPAPVWWMVGVTGLAGLFLTRTRLGFRLVCVGEAREAARLAGLRVRRLKLLGLALSGLCAGLASVVLTAALSSAARDVAGDFRLASIAAVMLGMTMFRPGHANVPGTLVGAVAIGMLGNALVLLGAPHYAQDIFLGVIIVASVAVSANLLTRAALEVY